MQSERFDNKSNISFSDSLGTDSKSDMSTFSKKKRRRNNNSDVWTKQQEDRILQYALKLSEKEYKRKRLLEQNGDGITKFEDIKECAVFYAKDEDFKNFIGFVNKCIRESNGCTGVIKIIPSSNWVEGNKDFFQRNVSEKIKNCQKKLYTRKQVLNQLYQAKVII
jgi:ribosomal protein S18